MIDQLDTSLTLEDIAKMIDLKKETPNLDYKVSLFWKSSHNDARLDIVKDILAMANMQDGGKLIIGVQDDNEFVGLTEEEYKTFDVTQVNTYLNNYSDPVFNCSVIKREINGKKVVVIDVPEFKETPIFCKKAAHSSKDQNKEILKKGGLYIRTDACESALLGSADQMRSLMRRSFLKQKDELVATIDNLISGKVAKNEKEPDKYKSEATDALKFLKSQVENFDSRGKIAIFMKPEPYDQRFLNQAEAGDAVQEAVVRLRGWDFPYVDMNGGYANFSDGKQSATISGSIPHYEAWRVYKSGFFAWTKVFREDLEGLHDKKILYFIGVIYQITEAMLFAKRLYSEKLGIDKLHVEILLTDCDNRFLFSNNTLTLSHERYKCLESRISIKRVVSTAELASYKEVAKLFIKEIFMMFNWNDPNEGMLESWQIQLSKGG